MKSAFLSTFMFAYNTINNTIQCSKRLSLPSLTNLTNKKTQYVPQIHQTCNLMQNSNRVISYAFIVNCISRSAHLTVTHPMQLGNFSTLKLLRLLLRLLWWISVGMSPKSVKTGISHTSCFGSEGGHITALGHCLLTEGN